MGLFGFMRSKSKKAALREGEKQDEFYTAADIYEGEDGMDDEDIDDQEYYRRVAEEVSKRKGSVTPSSRNSMNVSGHGSSHGRPVSTSKASNNESSSAASTPRSVPIPQALEISAPPHESSTTKAVTPTSQVQAKVTPTESAPVAVAAPAVTPAPIPPVAAPAPLPPTPPVPVVTAASLAAARAAASRPNPATAGPAPVTGAFVVSADRPFSATTPPGRALALSAVAVGETSKFGRVNTHIVPDEKALKSLVIMGFSRQAATLALQRTNNHADQASAFLLELSDEELKALES